MIGKRGMAVEGHPANLMRMSVKQQHACAQQGFWGRSGEEASRTEQGRTGPPLPREHQPRLTKNAYSFLFIFVVPYYSLELIDALFLCVYQVVRTVQYSVVSS